jgi:hypothetical protein
MTASRAVVSILREWCTPLILCRLAPASVEECRAVWAGHAPVAPLHHSCPNDERGADDAVLGGS